MKASNLPVDEARLWSDLMALAQHARRFADARVAPGYLERDQTRVLDRALMREMGELGFIGPELPEACGGQV